MISDEDIINSNASDAVKPKRKRRSKAEIEADKLAAKLETASKKVKAYAAKKEASASGVVPEEMYTLKFNSPILPFAKFPLTQNKYI